MIHECFLFCDGCSWVPCLFWTVELSTVLQKNTPSPAEASVFQHLLFSFSQIRKGVHKLSSSTVYIYIYIHIYVLHALTCTHFCVLTCTHFCEILYIWDFLWKKAVAKNLKLLNTQKNIRENSNLIYSPVILQRCWVWFVLLCEQKRFQIVWLPLWSGAVRTPLKLSHADI